MGYCVFCAYCVGRWDGVPDHLPVRHGGRSSSFGVIVRVVRVVVRVVHVIVRLYEWLYGLYGWLYGLYG